MTTLKIRNKFEVLFGVDGIMYKFIVTPDNEVIFQAISGRLKTGKYVGTDGNFGEAPQTNILNGTKNPRKVLREALEILKAFTKIHKPKTFSFTALEKNRIKLYAKLYGCIEKQTGYKMICGGDNNGTFIYAQI